MAYLESINVEVFPIAKERNPNFGSRLFTEHNVSNLIRQLMNPNSNGFIISSSQDNDKNWTIEFNLLGYYFKIKGINTKLINSINGSFKSVTGVYAYVKIDEKNNEIIGQDVQDTNADGENVLYYKGLNIEFKDPNTDIKDPKDHVKYLKLLDFNNDETNGPTLTTVRNNMGIGAASIGGIDGKYK